MIYLYNKKELTYKRLRSKHYLISTLIIIILLLSSFSIGFLREEIVKREVYENIIKIDKQKEELSDKAVKEYILSLNIKFPDIVYAQAILETGNFKHVKYNNLFGMRKATVRPTTASGVENGYSYYNSWKESVLDYALYQAAYLSDIHTRQEYLQYLKQFYAQDTLYINKINKICYEK